MNEENYRFKSDYPDSPFSFLGRDQSISTHWPTKAYPKIGYAAVVLLLLHKVCSSDCLVEIVISCEFLKKSLLYFLCSKTNYYTIIIYYRKFLLFSLIKIKKIKIEEKSNNSVLPNHYSFPLVSQHYCLSPRKNILSYLLSLVNLFLFFFQKKQKKGTDSSLSSTKGGGKCFIHLWVLYHIFSICQELFSKYFKIILNSQKHLPNASLSCLNTTL